MRNHSLLFVHDQCHSGRPLLMSSEKDRCAEKYSGECKLVFCRDYTVLSISLLQDHDLEGATGVVYERLLNLIRGFTRFIPYYFDRASVIITRRRWYTCSRNGISHMLEHRSSMRCCYCTLTSDFETNVQLQRWDFWKVPKVYDVHDGQRSEMDISGIGDAIQWHRPRSSIECCMLSNLSRSTYSEVLVYMISSNLLTLFLRSESDAKRRKWSEECTTNDDHSMSNIWLATL